MSSILNIVFLQHIEKAENFHFPPVLTFTQSVLQSQGSHAHFKTLPMPQLSIHGTHQMKFDFAPTVPLANVQMARLPMMLLLLLLLVMCGGVMLQIAFMLRCGAAWLPLDNGMAEKIHVSGTRTTRALVSFCASTRSVHDPGWNLSA